MADDVAKLEELDLYPGNYKNYGLSYSLGELERAFPTIFNLNLKQQSAYADAITKRYAKNPHFLKKQFAFLDPETMDVSTAKTTSIGNVAYIAINGPAPYNDIAMKVLTRTKRHFSPTPPA